MKDIDLNISTEELLELHESRTQEDKLKEALIHMLFVAQGKHAYAPDICNGCKDAKQLVQ